jgi:PleD family two-component response regulator
VTVSIGRASEAPAESDLDAMLRTADADMYKAKRGAKLAATTLA